MAVAIYTDTELNDRVDDYILCEGCTYFVDLSSKTPEQRQKLVADARLSSFGSRQFRNEIWEFRIDGFIGFIDFLDVNWDVRSKKLGLDGPGDEQFRHLLKDIEQSLGNYTFRYGTPATAKVASNAQSLAEDQVRLEYLQAFFLEDCDLKSVAALYEILFRRPHSTLQTNIRLVKAGKPGRFDSKAFVKNFRRLGISPQTPNTHPELATESMAALSIDSRKMEISHIPVRRAEVNFDTPENRFVKFILKDFEALCLRLLGTKNIKQEIYLDAENLLSKIRKYLSSAIFREVRTLTFFPSNSSVLTRDFVYASLYEHFMRSKFGTSHSLEEFRKQLRFSALKDVATLYEIWCFTQVANAIFSKGDIIHLENFDRTRSKFSNGCCWRADSGSLYFNKSFGPQSGSYSVTLRPDIVLEKRVGDKMIYWHFDAKYKLKETADDSGTAHAGDIHKMHTYVDAICGSVSSIALYPGTEMRMYPRLSEADEMCILSVLKSGGVGAFGLVPGRGQKDLQLAINALL